MNMADNKIEEEEEACAADIQPTNQTVSIPTSSWWSPWVEAAKVKSCEVFEFVKKDLNEISTVVKSEASSVVNSTATVLKDTFKFEEPNSRSNIVKKSVSSFIGSVSNVLSPLPDDDDQQAILIQNDAPVTLSRFQTKLFELIRNPDTFLLDIDESLMPQYNSWLSITEDQLSTDRLTKHLLASPDLHNQYEALVPEQVSHIIFWKRFLFRRAMLEDDESRREIKAKRERNQAEQIQWEKEDFAQNIQLSEEDQIKILSDYENETKKNNGSKNQDTEKKKKRKKKQKGGDEEDEELKMKLQKDMVIVADSNSSSHVSTSSGDTGDTGDTEGKDASDDWVKDFELDEAEDATHGQ